MNFERWLDIIRRGSSVVFIFSPPLGRRFFDYRPAGFIACSAGQFYDKIPCAHHCASPNPAGEVKEMQVKIAGGILGCLLSLLGLTALSYAAPPEEGLVLWFSFEKPPTGDTVKDLSGKGNDGQINGEVKWTPDGKYGGGMEFKNGGIIVPNSESLTFEDAITIALWIKSEDVPDAYRRLVTCGWGDKGSYILGIDNHWMNMAFAWDIINDGGTRFDANLDGLCIPGEWQFVTGTYDGEKLRLYVNGELKVESSASGKINGAYDIEIGWGEAPPGAGPFVGVMDEVRIYNRALSEEEIKQCMEEPSVQALNSYGKLPALWGKIKFGRL